MANQTPPQSPKQGFLERSISVRTAAAVLIAVAIVAVVVVIAIPRLQDQLSQEPSAKFEIISQSDWWTNEEVISGAGTRPFFHVIVEVENSGEAAGVCVLHVKAEEPGGRFWSRFRFVSVSPGDTVEEQFDFPEVVDENVAYSAWLTSS